VQQDVVHEHQLRLEERPDVPLADHVLACCEGLLDAYSQAGIFVWSRSVRMLRRLCERVAVSMCTARTTKLVPRRLFQAWDVVLVANLVYLGVD
jgi:hypothetical protein